MYWFASKYFIIVFAQQINHFLFEVNQIIYLGKTDDLELLVV